MARTPTYKGFISTFDTIGSASANLDIVTIFNRAGSGVLVAIREIRVGHEFPAGTQTLRTGNWSPITTNPTAGTLLTPVDIDTTLTHQALVEVRGAASVDAGVHLAMATHVASADRLLVPRAIAAQTGQIAMYQEQAVGLPSWIDDPLILVEGEGIYLEMTEATAATLHTAVYIDFEEFTEAGPVTVTPGVASLVTATFIPVVTASNHQLVTPTNATLVTTPFAPVLKHVIIPPVAGLTLNTFIPTVTATAHQTVTPAVASLVTASFIPVIKLTVVPPVASLTLTTFAPTVSSPVTVTPAVAALTLTTFAPTVSATAHQTVTPSTATLALTTFIPTVTGGAGQTVTPTTASLSLSTFVPTVSATAHQLVTPGLATLALNTFIPTVTGGAGLTLVPPTATLTLTPFAPNVIVPLTLIPGTRALVLTTFVPTVGPAGAIVTGGPGPSIAWIEYPRARVVAVVPVPSTNGVAIGSAGGYDTAGTYDAGSYDASDYQTYSLPLLSVEHSKPRI